MIKVTYTELDGPSGPTLRLEAAGHAGYAPAGQDIVCAGASTLMQTLVYRGGKCQKRCLGRAGGPAPGRDSGCPAEALGGGSV